MAHPLKSLYSFFPKQTIRLNKLNYLSQRQHFIRPPDPLIERQVIPINPPKFCKNYSFIEIPPFNNYKNEKEETFLLEKKDKIKIPFQEHVLDLYINSIKMLKKLVYIKENFNEEGKVTIDNIVNLKEYEREMKKNRHKKRKKDNVFNTENLIINNGFNINETLIFESKFESGNLQLVYLTEKSTDENNIEKIDKYQLFLHNDTNSKGYTQWFYFRVNNLKKGQTVNFSIMNMLRKTTKYCYGIKIWVYSRKKDINEKISWHHTEEKVLYYKNNLYRLNKGNRQNYHTLSFNYTSKYDDDEVYFANCIPYTYTDLMNDLNYYTKYENNKYPFFHRKKLCETLGGNDIEYITINNSDILNYNKELNKKKGIILIARQHPSETVGSWKIKGAIDFLLSDCEEAKYLRDKYIFKIIPMINVDGVISGNTRTSFAGCDLNRRWINPDEILHPEIYYSKKLILNLKQKIDIECIIDFHGHFGAFNSFFYGNFIEDNFEACKFYPFICGKISDVINFNKSIFKMPKYKRGTGRIHLFNELNIENIFTLETSYFGCVNGKYANQYLNIDKLTNIGKDICLGILYLNYHNNIKNGIKIINKKYPKLNNNIEINLNTIEKEFKEYIDKKEYNDIEKKEKENDEDYDSLSSNESNSESDPSGDNLDIEEIKKLISVKLKIKGLNKKKKSDRFYNKKIVLVSDISLNENNINNTNGNINILNSNIHNNNNNSLNINLPKVSYTSSDSKKKKIFISKRQSLLSASQYKKKVLDISITGPSQGTINIKDLNSYKRKNKNNQNEIKKINSQTQTEEVFFRMHWSYFIGSFTILSPKNDNNNVYHTSVVTTDYVIEKFGNGIIKKSAREYSSIPKPKLFNENSRKKIGNTLFNIGKKKDSNINSLNSDILDCTFKSLSNAFQIKSPFQIYSYNHNSYSINNINQQSFEKQNKNI